MFKNKWFKFFILVIALTISMFSLLLTNNVVNSAPVGYNSQDMDNITKAFESRNALFSMNTSYNLTYDINIINNRKSNYIPIGSNTEFNFNQIYTSTDGDFSYYFVKNDANVNSITVNQYDQNTNYINFVNGTNGNGMELVIKLNVNYYAFSYLTFYYEDISSESEWLNVESTNGCIQCSEHQLVSPYYTIDGECKEIRIKNVNNSITKVSSILFSYDEYELNNVAYTINKVDNKNQLSIQAIGRITKEEYDILVRDIGANVYFGMFYGFSSDYSDDELVKIAVHVVHGSSYDGSLNFIQEIKIADLLGYDVTGHNIVNENPVYYQWGVSINNISDKYFNTEIVAVPYILVGEKGRAPLWHHNAITYKSVKSMATEYSTLTTLNMYDSEFLKAFSKAGN